ncbi:MAG: NADH:ubiquinone reductase (Na(+)-transporting) subunit A [Myxococcales bacterium]|nr:NADH:ubiquinone reductase (Na(+)-transporting) subunit A [Myxococcales bacterium]
MSDIRFQKGLNIPMEGRPDPHVVDVDAPSRVALCPPDYPDLKFRLVVEQGETVAAGQPVLQAKQYPEIKLVSPTAGQVAEINRGARRALLSVVIEKTDGGEAVQGLAFSADRLANESGDVIKSAILAGGLWPLIRSKPLARTAVPSDQPAAILVSCMETGPLQAQPGVILQNKTEELALGLQALSRLTAGSVHVTFPKGSAQPSLPEGGRFELHTFSGPHPAGDAETQINFCCPPGPGQKVWYLRASDAALIGELLKTGLTPTHRTVAIVGTGIAKPAYYRCLAGAPLSHLIQAAGSTTRPVRPIGGSVFTGRTLDLDGFMSGPANTLLLLPDDVQRKFMGWTYPGISAFSIHRLFVSKLVPFNRYDLDTSINGGFRAMVPIGSYEKVVNSDIEPVFLLRAILAEDIEEMVNLGLLEISQEEAALCTFVCPSKLNFSEALQQGWAQYEREF